MQTKRIRILFAFVLAMLLFAGPASLYAQSADKTKASIKQAHKLNRFVNQRGYRLQVNPDNSVGLSLRTNERLPMVGLKNPKYKGKAPFTFVQELFDKCLYPYELSDKQLAGEVRLHFFIDTYGQMFFLPSRFFPYPKAQDPESPLVSQTDPFDELMMISAIEQVIDYNAIWSPVEDTAGQKYPMECFCCIPVSSHKSLIPLALYCRIQIEDFIPDDVIGVPSAFYLRFMFRNPKIY